MNQNHEKLLKRITIDPKVMTGKPVIKGTRLTVQYILKLMGSGVTIDQIIEEYPKVKKEDVRACLMYAAQYFNENR